MRNKACKPAGDCCVVAGGVDAAGHLILTLANGQTVDVGPVSGLALPVVVDGVTVTGAGTAASPLMGYQVMDNGDGTYTVTPPGGGALGAAFMIDASCEAVQACVAPMLASAFAYDDVLNT